MTKDYIQINDGDLIPIVTIKRLREMTDKDREGLAQLGDHVDPARFHSRIEFADGSKKYAVNTLASIQDQGAPLVETDSGTFVIGANIISARNLTENDRKDFEGRMGRPLRNGFKAQIETKAGTILATAKAETIMRRMGFNAELNNDSVMSDSSGSNPPMPRPTME